MNFNGAGQFKFALVDAGVDVSRTATATPVIQGGFGDGLGPRVVSITVTDGGAGYLTAPEVTISPPAANGTQATAEATIDGSGAVVSITVTAMGSQYPGNAVVTLSPPPPSLVSPTLWSNDGSSVDGAAPGNFVPLPVTQGLYSVRLGDVSLPGMTQAITPAQLAAESVSLRVWFNDGSNGFQLLTPDQPLASSAFALVAGTAAHATSAGTALTVPDGPITAAKLAPGLPGTGVPPVTIQLIDLPHASATQLEPGWSAIPISPVTLINDQWTQHLNPQSTPTFNIDTFGKKTHVWVWTGSEFIAFGARLNTDQGADWYADGGRLPVNQAGHRPPPGPRFPP